MSHAFRRRQDWLCRLTAWLDYDVGLPLIARLPPSVARPFVVLRGTVNFLLDLEWRTLALRHGYIRGATAQAMRHVARLTRSDIPPWRLTLGRFIRCSWEEYDSQRLDRLDYTRLRWEATGLEKVLACARSGQGIVLLVAHFDSLYVGMMLLAGQPLRINLMSSRIIEEERVPSPIRRHFARKVAALRSRIAPGRVRHFEDGIKPFTDALKRGEIVIIACDGPASSDKRGSVVNFLGSRYVMAPGPEFLARRTSAAISLFSCVREASGCFRIDITEPLSWADGGLQRAFDQLDTRIRAEPWRWWGADLFRGYRVASSDAREASRAGERDPDACLDAASP